LYSSFVHTIQSFVCFAEPEAGAGSHHPKPGPEETTDLTAAAEVAPAAEAAQAEGEIAPHATSRGSGASTHPVG